MYSELNDPFFKVPKGFNEFQRATKTSQQLSVLFFSPGFWPPHEFVLLVLITFLRTN